MERIILHSDLNNFYASVACLSNPSLCGKPIAVAGDPEKRHGVVLAKNDFAKRFGVRTGEALWQARAKCPDILFVPPDYTAYAALSQQAKAIYARYTDRVEGYGIDECWMDVTGSVGLFGSGGTIADEIRRTIHREIGVTVSVGVSFNKIFAKLGSDLKKPNATTQIPRASFREIVWPLPVEAMLYVGGATRQKLRRYSIRTIGELANTKRTFLRCIMGKQGEKLWQFANGLDQSPVSVLGQEAPVKSIGNSTTAPHDLTTEEEIRITLYTLCDSVASRLRQAGKVCATVQIMVKDTDFACFERQGKLAYPTCASSALFERAYALFYSRPAARPVRTLGVTVTELDTREYEQLSFLPEAAALRRDETLERTMDHIRAKYGYTAIRRGILLADPSLCDLEPQNNHIIQPKLQII